MTPETEAPIAAPTPAAEPQAETIDELTATKWYAAQQELMRLETFKPVQEYVAALRAHQKIQADAVEEYAIGPRDSVNLARGEDAAIAGTIKRG